MNPMFSIIIPCLNEEKFLPKLLTSLALQTQKDFEVIVVDGASVDKTVARAKAFAKKLPNLTIVQSERGVSKQRNAGAKAANGAWLVFVDADGEFKPYFIERVSRFIAAKKPKLFTTWFTPDSDHTGDAIITLLNNLTLEGSVSIRKPFAPGMLTLVEKDAFLSVGGYDEAITFAEDYDLGQRLHKSGITLQILRETLCVYSLRRFRREGRLKTVQTHARAMLAGLLMRPPKQNRGYVMGGHLYNGTKTIEPSALKRFQTQAKKLVKEFFE